MAVASAGVAAERAEAAAPHPKAVPIAAGALGLGILAQLFPATRWTPMPSTS